MSEIKKTFSKQDYFKFDEPGKKVVRKYFDSNSRYLVAENPNDYKADLILLERCEDGRYVKVALIEVGIRDSWTGKVWPTTWDLHIEKRKSKYVQDDLPVWFCILNHTKDAMVLFQRPLADYAIVNVDNRVLKKEPMYAIPKSDFEVIILNKDEDLI